MTADGVAGQAAEAITDRAWNDDPVRRRAAWLAVCVAAASIFLFVADSGVVSLSLPKIEAEHPGVSRATLAWIANAFLVVQAALLLVGGRLGDRRGRKRFYLLGLVVFSAGSALTALAPTIGWMITARAVQGAGAAFLTSSALALVLPMFPSSKTPVVIGAWGSIGSVAAWLTPTAGSVLIDHEWRLGFAVVAAVGLTIAILGRRVLVEQTDGNPGGRTDRVSYYLGPAGLGLAMLVLAQGARWGWTSPTVLGLGVLAAALVVAFLHRCATATTPLLDLALLRVPAFTANAMAGVLQQIAFFGWFLTGPLIMTALWGWSVREAGLVVALGQVGASFASPLGGRLAGRFGNTLLIVVSSLITAGGSGWLLLTATARPNFWGVALPASVLMGFGSGICGTMTTGAALAALPASMLGSGNSFVQLVRRMGGAVGVALAAALLGEAKGAALLGGARRVWWMVTLVHVAMSAPLWRLPSRRSR